MARNSSKSITPSPLTSYLPIISLHSFTVVDCPNRRIIFFKLFGVITRPSRPEYIPNAPFNSSSSPSFIIFAKSSNPNTPSPSASDNLTAISASSSDNCTSSPPTFLSLFFSSVADIIPSPFSSK
ncbi:hypothetical protein HanRHA438_Chr08g0339191 [Helianthus annuus]|uniref:Uncharacterized protein n=1 Tax=Helianthus annuus TaxID=4232 RepID=A0A251U3F7_HELAN|nr:hypothetical protein HanXRQr2_Chr08g0327971 [Helianthus annuus]KAJ0545838.1 hypothetical protein HanIR_Chr08g0354221 [Helianthus annuus]KAJ0896851.1 hypothetical protein HanRHA438_Chr08g0339191 [Helianthus annuus]KAJ0900735.1 hypothetical protein HanPSC8_Chr08g0317141 [Helianthus annuus]